jgi:hypothetical protein
VEKMNENTKEKKIIEILKEGSFKWMKGFIVGYTIQNIPSILSLIFKIISHITTKTKKKLKIIEIIKRFLKNLTSNNVIGFGVSIGFINGGYYLLKNILNNYIQNEKTVVLISSFISSFGIYFDKSKVGKERRLILSLYLFVFYLKNIKKKKGTRINIFI